MGSEIDWEEAKRTLSVGDLLCFRVTQNCAFGIFLEIPNVPFQGLVQVADFRDEGCMTSSHSHRSAR